MDKQAMSKRQVLAELTKLYDICYDASSNDASSTEDDGWMAIAGAISTAEDVAYREIQWDDKDE